MVNTKECEKKHHNETELKKKKVTLCMMYMQYV